MNITVETIDDYADLPPTKCFLCGRRAVTATLVIFLEREMKLEHYIRFLRYESPNKHIKYACYCCLACKRELIDDCGATNTSTRSTR